MNTLQLINLIEESNTLLDKFSYPELATQPSTRWASFEKAIRSIRYIAPDNYNHNQAITLPADAQGINHSSGWTIHGEIVEDYYTWINAFVATHPKYGKVWGDFEKIVFADSELGYLDFIQSHSPDHWDYQNI